MVRARRFSVLTSGLLLCAALLSPAAGSRAATIEVNRSGAHPIVILRGTLELEDGEIFANKISGLPHSIVLLSSPGGNLSAGLRIGKLIHLRGFDTIVPDGVGCASACALAWLGGSTRYMGPKALVGFHAAALKVGGQTRETGAGNALIGAYLSQLGLSDETIIYLTIKPPESMMWLSIAKARALGISIAIFSLPETPPKPAPPVASLPRETSPSPPAPIPTRDLDSLARSFVQAYFEHWSENNSDALRYFRSVYSETVNFFDKPIPATTLLEEKRKFADRWPQRIYSALPATIKTSCDPKSSTCEVTGQVEWDCRAPRRRGATAGTAAFTFQISVPRTGSIRIDGEWSTVVTRQK